MIENHSLIPPVIDAGLDAMANDIVLCKNTRPLWLHCLFFDRKLRLKLNSFEPFLLSWKRSKQNIAWSFDRCWGVFSPRTLQITKQPDSLNSILCCVCSIAIAAFQCRLQSVCRSLSQNATESILIQNLPFCFCVGRKVHSISKWCALRFI